MYTRSPNRRGHGVGTRHFGHGKDHGFRGFAKGHRFGHVQERDFGSVFYFVPFSYYPYYYSYYGRYPYYGGSPYYYDDYYYGRPPAYYRPYEQPYAQPYEQPDDPSYDQPQEPSDGASSDQPDDGLKEEYEKLEQERAAEQANVSGYLRQIAEPFRGGDYPEALRQAEAAAGARHDNPVLGFAYTQALVANGQYDRADDVLRRALTKVDMRRQGVLFGEDFYPNPAALQERIADLERTAQVQPGAADLYLLLGYEFIASGRHDDVAGALRNAQSYANRDAVSLLEEIAERMRDTAPADN